MEEVMWGIILEKRNVFIRMQWWKKIKKIRLMKVKDQIIFFDTWLHYEWLVLEVEKDLNWC